ncbi:2-C-methyl-D-erythritol 2,4-cyclodiphosphate synthase [Candidatus Poribacteria bacterium]|nr:2-C-methyl-D-erythritol 2,4-cyclodiphosphate synthase [Candidatus Poribacteria bacterium]
MRIGIGYDIHRLIENRDLILGGVIIPCEMGLEGHSDADVLTHSICDAMLGALALGDIGQHFPDNDQQYKGISSMILLERVNSLIHERGFIVNNIDSVIIAQRPRLADFIPEMRVNIAEILNINLDRVSVKATTNEKLDSIGKAMAIGVEAVVSLRENR